MWTYRPDALQMLYGTGAPSGTRDTPTLYVDITANRIYLSPGGGAAYALQSGALTAYATDGAILPTIGKAVLTKGSAGAYTLAAPATDGQILILTNGTAFAHVVTATGLLQDGVTGGAKTTATFGAFVGSSIEFISYNSKWNVVAKNVVTIA